MKLMAKGGAELRYFIAVPLLPGTAFMTPEAGAFGTVFVLIVMLLLLLVVVKTSSSAASWLSLDSQELVAHYSMRPSKRIPLSRIAAVEVRPSALSGVPFVDATWCIAVFRKDAPDIIEITARSWEAEAFSFALARNAKRLGVSGLAPFAVPRSQYVHDLVPILPGLGILFLFPFRIGWPSFALAVGVFVFCSALAWLRFAKLAKRILAGEVPAALGTWVRLLRTCPP
jgi:hypothetical protein